MRSSTSWLVYVVIALALVNLGALGFIWLHTDKPAATEERGRPPGEDARTILVRELALDPEQTRRFDGLRSQHQAAMRDYREQMRELKDRLFDGLQDEKDSSAAAPAARAIGELQAQIDLTTYAHFRAVRALCNPGQKEKFDRVIQQVIRNMGGPMRPPGPPPPGEGHPGGPPW